MPASGQPREHPPRRIDVGGLAEDRAVEHHLGVRAQHRPRRQLALLHALPADGRLGARDALDVVQRRLVVARFLDDVAMASRRVAQAQFVELDADLPQQLLAARTARREIDDGAQSRW